MAALSELTFRHAENRNRKKPVMGYSGRSSNSMYSSKGVSGRCDVSVRMEISRIILCHGLDEKLRKQHDRTSYRNVADDFKPSSCGSSAFQYVSAKFESGSKFIDDGIGHCRDITDSPGVDHRFGRGLQNFQTIEGVQHTATGHDHSIVLQNRRR